MIESRTNHRDESTTIAAAELRLREAGICVVPVDRCPLEVCAVCDPETRRIAEAA